MFKKVVALGDTHFPFHDHDALEKSYKIIAEVKPEMVIQMGDLYDMFSFSKYPKGISSITPEDECASGRLMAVKMWDTIKKISPKSKKFQITGNHDERVVKSVLYKAPEHEHVARHYLDHLMTFSGVESVLDSKDELVFDGVMYQHGFRKFGEHAHFNQMNTVCGHLHRGALTYNQNINGSFFELNVGWLGNKSEKAFSYRSQNKISKTTVGVGVVDAYGPRFVSFEH